MGIQQNVCLGLCMLLSIIGFMLALINLSEYHEYSETNCNITNIKYPKELPNSTNQDDFVKCDCGRNCYSQGYCVKVFTNDDQIIMYDRMINNKYQDKCTFYESKCINGESVIDRRQAIENAQEIAEDFTVGQNVTCYTDGEDIYLNNSYNWIMFYFTIVLFVLSVILCFLCNDICCILNKFLCKKEKNIEDVMVI